jgi:hypothetical protein
MSPEDLRKQENELRLIFQTSGLSGLLLYVRSSAIWGRSPRKVAGL